MNLHSANRQQGKLPGHWLVLVDAHERRQDEEAKYQARQRALANSHAKLHAFETIDVPEFQKWFESELAGPLGTLRMLQRELDHLERRLAEIETYAAYAGVSLRSASKTVEAAANAGTLDELWADGDGSDSQSTEKDRDRYTDADDPLKEDDVYRPREKQIRDIYKQLVRLLHPDLHPKRPQLHLWHEVQRAYLAGDTEALERILDSVTKAAKREPDLGSLPIGEIMNLRLGVEKKLRHARRRLRAAKDHPAWNFRRLTKNHVGKRALRCSLNAAISMDVEAMQARARALRIALRRLSR